MVSDFRLREEDILKLLGTVVGPERHGVTRGPRKLHDEEKRNIYFSVNIFGCSGKEG